MSGTHRSDETPPTRPTEQLGQPVTAYDEQEASVVRHEERTDVSTELTEAGRVRVRKHVETLPVEQAVERSVEHADDSERVPADEGDTGEVITLPDGSVSIPVFEEVLVVTKKLVVRERVVVRKHTTVDEHVLRTELRREHVEVEGVGDVEVEERATPPVGRSTRSDEGPDGRAP
jgi:uncharacterized protein (TIGR02271 family)